MDCTFILVISHERSGTHFLIDSLVNNLKMASFPYIRPSFTTLENLVLPHDRVIVDKWYDFINDKSSKIKLFKTHFLPRDIQNILEVNDFLPDRERKLFELIWDNAKKIYIFRDGKDVLVSLYHRAKGGGGQWNSTGLRLQEASFSEFIRMPNRNIFPMRMFAEIDRNFVTYWKHHVQAWLATEDVVKVSYEDLKTNYKSTVVEFVKALDMEIHLKTNIVDIRMGKRRSLYLYLNILNRLVCPPLINKALTRLKSKQKSFTTAVLPRRGVVGDWRNYFDEDDIQYFNEIAGDFISENWGDGSD